MQAKAEWSWNTVGISGVKATVWSVTRDDFSQESRSDSSYDVFSGSFVFQQNNVDPLNKPIADLWLLKGDSHNVKESFLVGRVESKPLELVEQETKLVWEGKFFGDACSDEKEHRFKYYYPGIKTTCSVYIYNNPKMSGYYPLGDIVFTSKPKSPPIGYLIKVKFTYLIGNILIFFYNKLFSFLV